MNTHTPGPWKIDTFGNIHQIIADGETVVARVTSQAANQKAETERTTANARLIAAAPEMLEALEGLLREAPAPKGIKQGLFPLTPGFFHAPLSFRHST